MRKRTLQTDEAYLNYLDWLAVRVAPERMGPKLLSDVFVLAEDEAERLFALWQKGEA